MVLSDLIHKRNSKQSFGCGTCGTKTLKNSGQLSQKSQLSLSQTHTEPKIKPLPTPDTEDINANKTGHYFSFFWGLVKPPCQCCHNPFNPAAEKRQPF